MIGGEWSTRRGFTLLEILIALAIVVSLIGIGGFAILSSAQERSFAASADRLAALMDDARGEAIRRRAVVAVRVEHEEPAGGGVEGQWLVLREMGGSSGDDDSRWGDLESPVGEGLVGGVRDAGDGWWRVLYSVPSTMRIVEGRWVEPTLDNEEFMGAGGEPEALALRGPGREVDGAEAAAEDWVLCVFGPQGRPMAAGAFTLLEGGRYANVSIDMFSGVARVEGVGVTGGASGEGGLVGGEEEEGEEDRSAAGEDEPGADQLGEDVQGEDEDENDEGAL